MLRELVPRLEVGEIASSLAGNHDLPAQTRHLLKHCIPETFKGANLAFTDPLMHPSDASLLHPCTDSLCFTHSFTTLSADSFKNGLTSPPVFSFPGTLIYVTVHPLFSSFSSLGSDPVLGISTWVTQSSSTQRGTSDVDREVS